MLCRWRFTIIILWNEGRTVRQAPTLQFGRCFPLVSDKKRRRFFRCSYPLECAATAEDATLFNASKAVALVDAGNSSHAHGERCSREMSTLFSWRIARFWFAEVFFFDLFPSFALFAQLILCVAFGLLPRLRGHVRRSQR